MTTLSGLLAGTYQGYTGSQGIQGTFGITGFTGSQGTQGIQGITGGQGTQGIQGITGSQGIQGITGPGTIITATNDTTTTTLYPVMVGAAGSAQTPKVSTPYISFNAATGSLILSEASGPQITFTGTTSEWIQWPAAVGAVGAPTFTTSSVGTKLLLYPGVGAAAADFAIGIESSTLWFGVPTADSVRQFKWYGGTTQAMLLSGAGALTTAGTISDIDGNVRNLSNLAKTAAYVPVAGDNGNMINITTGGVTINTGVFVAGNNITVYNNSGVAQTITQGTGVTMYLAGTATTGNRTLAQRGVCTILCVVDSTTFVASGAGLT